MLLLIHVEKVSRWLSLSSKYKRRENRAALTCAVAAGLCSVAGPLEAHPVLRWLSWNGFHLH